MQRTSGMLHAYLYRSMYTYMCMYTCMGSTLHVHTQDLYGISPNRLTILYNSQLQAITQRGKNIQFSHLKNKAVNTILIMSIFINAFQVLQKKNYISLHNTFCNF
uniref:Uncharacterized protein n=1 Tax=Anguilla anguilla TaxID=7936 RepID=A0A0E9XHG8_ANGAN